MENDDMTFAAMLPIQGKMILVAVLALVALIAAIIYLPIGLVREVTRSEHEVLPEWMGTVKARRKKLRIVIALIGGLSFSIVLAIFFTEPAPEPEVKLEHPDNEPLSGTIEGLLTQINSIPEGTESFEIFVPKHLTESGRSVEQKVAIKQVEYSVQSRHPFLASVGFEERPTGRWYSYRIDEGRRAVYLASKGQSSIYDPDVARKLKAALAGKDRPAGTAFDPTESYSKREILGYKILVNPAVDKHPDEAKAAFAELETQLKRIEEVVPEKPLASMKKIKFWVEWDINKNGATEFHVSKGYGFNPEKVHSIEINNLRNFVALSQKTQPWMILRELAHAYHFTVLGDKYVPLQDAYKQAMDRKLYDSVEFVDGGKHLRQLTRPTISPS
jgi:hypothetical protein